jgi:hypothetical protein
MDNELENYIFNESTLSASTRLCLLNTINKIIYKYHQHIIYYKISEIQINTLIEKYCK